MGPSNGERRNNRHQKKAVRYLVTSRVNDNKKLICNGKYGILNQYQLLCGGNEKAYRILFFQLNYPFSEMKYRLPTAIYPTLF